MTSKIHSFWQVTFSVVLEEDLQETWVDKILHDNIDIGFYHHIKHTENIFMKLQDCNWCFIRYSIYVIFLCSMFYDNWHFIRYSIYVIILCNMLYYNNLPIKQWFREPYFKTVLRQISIYTYENYVWNLKMQTWNPLHRCQPLFGAISNKKLRCQ